MPLDFTPSDPQTRKQIQGSVNYHAGLAAEDAVLRAYSGCGAKLLHRRWRGKAGEVDLVLRHNKKVKFIEVKKAKTHAQAVQSLSKNQQKRLAKAAEEYLSMLPAGALTDVQFDLAVVNARGAVGRIENALML